MKEGQCFMLFSVSLNISLEIENQTTSQKANFLVNTFFGQNNIYGTLDRKNQMQNLQNFNSVVFI